MMYGSGGFVERLTSITVAKEAPDAITLVCDEDALGQHDVNANVSVHEFSNAYVTCHAGQHIGFVVAQMLL